MEGDLGSNLYTGTPVVPPPPDADSSSALAEVTIRTMASDIELLGETGGSAPTGTTVAIPVALRSGADSGEAEGDLPPPPSSGGFRTMLWSLLGIVAVIGLFFGGYYLIPRFVGSVAPAPAPQSPAPTSSPTLPPGEELGFVHRSFFVGPSDAVITISLGDPRIPEAVRAFPEQALSLVKGASAGATFFELENVLPSGDAASWKDFASSTGFGLLQADFVAARFEPDFTAFAIRNKDGVFPGYILKLKKGQTPLTLRTQVAASIEGAGEMLAELFLSPIAMPTGTLAFRDAQINNQSVRVLSFGKDNSPPSILYGWFFNSYLVISTSEEGMRDAVGRL